MRVFMGLEEIAGYFSGLKEGFETLGVPCCLFTTTDHRFGYTASDSPNLLTRLVRWFAAQRTSDHWPRFMRKQVFKTLQRLAMFPVFLWALARHDAFILGYHSRFGFYDLPLLKLARRRIVHVFFGSDSRPGYLDGTVVRNEGPRAAGRCLYRTRKNKRFIRRVERFADHIVSYPLHSHLHEREIVFSSLLGFPVATPAATAGPPERSDGPIRILHCPSDPLAKGSEIIAAAVRSLVDAGLGIEYVTITGQPNSVVLEELARCDFVVDQLYNEAPVAGIVAEAAGFGKPAIVGSYGRDEITDLFPAGRMFPVHLCHPDSIREAVERLVTDTGYRERLGSQAARFLREEWRPERVAERYLRILRGRLDPAWRYRPAEIRYLHGACLSEAAAREQIRAVVEFGGEAALELDDKPELRRAMLEFAGTAGASQGGSC